MDLDTALETLYVNWKYVNGVSKSDLNLVTLRGLIGDGITATNILALEIKELQIRIQKLERGK